MTIHRTNRQRADAYRNTINVTGGYVRLYNDRIDGWMKELKPPSEFAPSCRAVDSDGVEYIATGGCIDSGAVRWEKL